MGFAKHQEYLECWNWFDHRLKYSRQEYEKVQEWLNTSLSTYQSSTTLVNSSDQSGIQSPVILLTKPTFCSIENEKMTERSIFNRRQISYLLKSINLEKNENETLRSSMSVNILSETTTPESIGLQQDHLFSAKIEHVNSFFIKNKPSQTFIEQTPGNQQVNFELDYDEETRDEEINDDEEKEIDSFAAFIKPNESLENNHSQNLTKENRDKIFREFLRKRLRKFGLTKTFDKIREVLLGCLSHALLALQIDKCERSALTQLNDYHLIPLHHKCRELIQNFYHDQESIK